MLCTITKSIQKPRGSLNETRTTAVGIHLLGLPSLGRTPVHRHQWTTFRAREDGTWDWKAELRLKAGAPSRCKLFVSSPLQPRRNLLEGDRDIFIPRLLHLDTHTLPSTIVILATFLLGLQPHSQLTSPPFQQIHLTVSYRHQQFLSHLGSQPTPCSTFPLRCWPSCRFSPSAPQVSAPSAWRMSSGTGQDQAPSDG